MTANETAKASGASEGSTGPRTHPWVGRILEGYGSAQLGEIMAVYAAAPGQPDAWALVRHGLLGRRTTLVPLAEAEERGVRVRVAVLKAAARSAPAAAGEPGSAAVQRAQREHFIRAERDLQPQPGRSLGHA